MEKKETSFRENGKRRGAQDTLVLGGRKRARGFLMNVLLAL